jgi:hypothetical protein
MSWDVSIVAADSPPPPVADMPDDWKGVSMGSSEEVRSAISGCLGDVDWSDPTWGHFYGDGFSFEFNIVGMCEGRDMTGFMIHVRGGGNAIEKLISLSDATGWFLLDCSQGEWLHHCEDHDAGWVGFQEYRDRVLERSHPPQ